MGYVKWSYETLNHFCGDVFKAFGFSEEESNQIKDVLLTADLYGIESHGMQRMVRYHKGIEKGTIHPQLLIPRSNLNSFSSRAPRVSRSHAGRL